MLRQAVSLSVVVAATATGIIACGDNGASDCGDRQSVSVNIGSFTFAMFRDGARDWELLKAESSAQSGICVSNDYVIVAVCERPTKQLRVRQHAATPLDGQPVEFGSCLDEDTTILTTVGMNEGGTVSIGSSSIGNQTGPWTFDLPITPGVHDLVASDFDIFASGGTRVVVRRDVNFDGQHQEPSIDLVLEGHSMMETAMQIDGVMADEVMSNGVRWLASDTVATLSQSAGTVARVAPPEIVEPDDVQLVSVNARTINTDRQVVVRNDFDRAFSLLPRIADEIQYDDGVSGIRAMWETLPVSEFDLIQLSAIGSQQFFASATRRWLDARRANHIELDSTAPGFEERWIVHDMDVTSTTLAIVREVPGAELSTMQQR